METCSLGKDAAHASISPRFLWFVVDRWFAGRRAAFEYLSYHNRSFRNFRVVEEGVLYRSGQLNVAGLSRIIHDYGIKTVVSLPRRRQNQ